jgi:hypothetical protein
VLSCRTWKPADRPYPFVYFITIHNDSAETPHHPRSQVGRRMLMINAWWSKAMASWKFPRLETGEHFSTTATTSSGRTALPRGRFRTTEDGSAFYAHPLLKCASRVRRGVRHA